MRGESGEQVGNKREASQAQAGGLVGKNVGARQEQEGGESRMNRGESGTAIELTIPLVCLYTILEFRVQSLPCFQLIRF